MVAPWVKMGVDLCEKVTKHCECLLKGFLLNLRKSLGAEDVLFVSMAESLVPP